jgi:KUP system potassium uptake protein
MINSLIDTKNKTPLSVAGVLITMGIVFGDIGTSPLYVFQAITNGGKNISESLILGGLSAVIWTLILIASIKYMYFALNADNNGEGGIFALYALLKKKRAKWIVIPALIGCATLMADGFITPAISISSAVEGLNNLYPNLPTIPIVVGIIITLFSIQQFGTVIIGRAFGPIMLIWFVVLFYLGITHIGDNPMVLKALNPYYAYNLAVNVDGGFWVFGAVLLCATGAEALYSDLGHCGKKNIRISWTFMFIILLIHYFGQAAMILTPGFALKPQQSIFYAMVPENLLPLIIGIATAAAIIASQALITGVYTLMNEAIKMKLWTNLKIKYPTDHQGQVYIPAINWFLMVGCLVVIAVFQKSENMEAAYGMAITINMVMTTYLLAYVLVLKYPKTKVLYVGIFFIFLFVESIFFVSNLGKIVHGGWFTLVLSAIFFIFLFIFYQARKLRSSIAEYVPMSKVIPLLNAVRNDKAIGYEATHLVYPTRSNSSNRLDASIFYSLFRKKPRKADVYWFVHLDIKTEPWGISYSVDEIIDKHSYFVSLHLGFKEEHRLEFMLRKIHTNMVEKGKLEGASIFESVKNKIEEVDFKFIILNTRVATNNKLTASQTVVVKVYRFIKSLGLKSSEDFGLDQTNVIEEFIPISVTKEFDSTLRED